MPNPDFAAELGSIPYEEVIGTPLRAAVEANAKASMTAADFIRSVGFTEPTVGQPEPVTVEFGYEKRTVDDSGNETTEQRSLSVPLLLLLNIPYFEVSNVTIDFNVKLNSVESYEQSSEFEFGYQQTTEASANLGFLQGKTKSEVSVSYQRSSSRGQEIERTYDQSVHVEAESVEPPEGVNRLMGALEQTIADDSSNGNGNGNGNSNGNTS
ncbi:hypothetical protein C471_01614 [Halorubrum saccharovorum DSM 1137]|uniref:DUF2589 domain-containing protein n=1 Tax=Halorubrum saccharovorum DSM 1137 TaxID=1227484 RepID=M0E9N1_9EURY|nr:DUF2589 domain-containing protein [Halorubrum saccharovorum]ELZ43114.1 hypothetical protein C471_01614 [Halorubrum saccharovorum DSM 1137]